MSNQVQDFQIKIVTAAELHAAQAAAGALQNVGTAAKESSTAQVNAGKEVEKVEKEAFTSKQELKKAVKGLQDEFPILAHVARMAINPITLAVAAASGAWAIWKTRVDALVTALGGVEMPEVGDKWTKAPQEAGKVWREYAEAIKLTVAKYYEAEAASARAITRIKAESELRQAEIKAVKDYAEAKLEAEKSTLPAGEYEKRKAELGVAAGAAELGEKSKAELDEWYAKNEKINSMRQEAARKEAEAASIRVKEETNQDLAGDIKAMGEAAEKARNASKELVQHAVMLQAGEGSHLDRIWLDLVREHGPWPEAGHGPDRCRLQATFFRAARKPGEVSDLYG